MTKQLITISDNAAKRIKEILSNAESGVKGVRVSVKSGGCAGMEKYYRDAKIGKIYEGTTNMQLQTIAKMILE